jgi:hypothetical protein
MTQDIRRQVLVEGVLSSAVADDGTLTVSYPSGYTQASFIGSNASATGTFVLNNNDVYEEATADNFEISYGASDITVTNRSGASWAAGSKYTLGLAYADVVYQFSGQKSANNGVGLQTLAFFVNLADIANGDIVTEYVPGYEFKIESVDFRVGKAVTTAAKLATLNMEIGTTNLTGGAVALTSAACTPAGAAVAGTAVTANNTGKATDSFSIEASSVTAFAEGTGWILVKIRNMATYNALQKAGIIEA